MCYYRCRGVVMEDCRENFKRDLDRLTYMYAKANTISKKKQIASDLLFFEYMFLNNHQNLK